MKMGGWSRLATVLTLVWLAAVLAWCLRDYHSNSRTDSLLIHWEDHKPKPWEIEKIKVSDTVFQT